MTDTQDTSAVLLEILRVLQTIERKLDKQDELSFHLGNSPVLGREGQNLNVRDNPNSSPQDGSDPGPPAEFESPLGQLLEPIEVPYSRWGSGQEDRETDEELQDILQKNLGDFWRIPADNRIPLKIIKSTDSKTGDFVADSLSSSIFEKKVKLFCRFDAVLKSHKGNNFLVIDYDLANNTRLYSLGEKAVGHELMVLPEAADNAPWSRLILYQGMATGESIPERGKLGSASPEPIPYFGRSDASPGLWAHLFSHLQLKRRADTTNPYADPGTGFHTLFYEIRNDKHLQVKELWKNGPLYDHPQGWFFRKSAYTLYTSPPSQAALHSDGQPAKLARHWTILLLAPDHFYDDNNTSFPMGPLDTARAQALGHCLGKLTREGAEMNLIAHGFERISLRWTAFESFLEFILDGGDSLMQPAEHDNLLFDDGAFSRSRRYFWAIDCLSEFEVTISDNIVQWELYKTARILPVLDAKGLPELDSAQLRRVERQYKILQNQREFFRRKLASTKALRDALFNASAVIESRASTRLGENVRLLTFVSIFFLPLSFCTSLRSINDRFSSTDLIIVIIIVAVATYVTMFNINTLVDAFRRIYGTKKTTIVKAMKSDEDEIWQQRGQRFEVFRPKHENPKPSEWYITLYAFLNPLLLFGFRRGTGRQHEEAAQIKRALQPAKYLRKPKPNKSELSV